MTELYQTLVKLGSERPELRPHIRPLLAKTASDPNLAKLQSVVDQLVRAESVGGDTSEAGFLVLRALGLYAQSKGAKETAILLVRARQEWETYWASQVPR